MRLQNPYAAIATTGLDAQVLTVLARGDAYLTVDQIHRLLPEEGSAPGVRKSLGRLVREGTVLERATGRSLGFTLNRDHLLIDAFLAVADAERALIARIAAAVNAWPVAPITVKLFGSAARGEMRSDSDIDLLFVVQDDAAEDDVEEAVGGLAARVTAWTGNDTRPLVYRAGDPQWLRRQLRDRERAA